MAKKAIREKRATIIIGLVMSMLHLSLKPNPILGHLHLAMVDLHLETTPLSNLHQPHSLLGLISLIISCLTVGLKKLIL
jgi:hypothetical protein